MRKLGRRKNSENSKCAQRRYEQKLFFNTVLECKLVQPTWIIIEHYLLKLKTCLSCDQKPHFWLNPKSNSCPCVPADIPKTVHRVLLALGKTKNGNDLPTTFPWNGLPLPPFLVRTFYSSFKTPCRWPHNLPPGRMTRLPPGTLPAPTAGNP